MKEIIMAGPAKAATTAVYTFVQDTDNGKLYIDLPFKRANGLRKQITLKGGLATSNGRGALDRADLRYVRDTKWSIPSSNNTAVTTVVSGQSMFSLQVRHTANLPQESRAAHVREFLALLQANLILITDGVISSTDVINVPNGTEQS